MNMNMKIRSQLLVSFLVMAFILTMPVLLASQPTQITNTPNWLDTSPRMDVDSRGNIHLVYAQYYGASDTATTGDAIYMKYDISIKQWSSPVNLSNNKQVHSDEFRPVDIDIDTSNNIYVVYVEKYNARIMLRMNSGGTWGAPFEVAATNGWCDTPRIAVDSSGNIFTCWWDSLFRCYSRSRIGGSWENVIEVSSGMGKFPDIAVGNNVVYCCWTERDANADPSVYKIHYTKRSKGFNASWSFPQEAAFSVDKQQTPAVEIDSNDIAHLVWATESAGGRIVYYSSWTGSRFSSPIALSGDMLLHYPSMCERRGNIYVCWQVGGFMNGSSVNTNNKINGQLTGEGEIARSEGCTFPDLATSPSQNKIYYVWDASGELWFDSVDSKGIATKNDFNADGWPDILWRYDGSGGANVVWYMKGATHAGSARLPAVTGLNWQIVGTGDFNRDGWPDILWRFNGSGGRNVVWYMKGATLTGTASLSAITDLNWQIVGTGDFNGDGWPDILWRYDGSGGENVVWYMKGTTRTGSASLPAATDLNWKIEGTGDFNGDGKEDILWRHHGKGYNLIWYLDGVKWIGNGWLPTVADTNWEIEGTGDFNGDGMVDILVRNYEAGSGQNGIFYMNGVTIITQEYLETVADLNWKIENH
jgi:hypothetical protein